MVLDDNRNLVKRVHESEGHEIENTRRTYHHFQIEAFQQSAKLGLRFATNFSEVLTRQGGV